MFGVLQNLSTQSERSPNKIYTKLSFLQVSLVIVSNEKTFPTRVLDPLDPCHSIEWQGARSCSDLVVKCENLHSNYHPYNVTDNHCYQCVWGALMWLINSYEFLGLTPIDQFSNTTNNWPESLIFTFRRNKVIISLTLAMFCILNFSKNFTI